MAVCRPSGPDFGEALSPEDYLRPAAPPGYFGPGSGTPPPSAQPLHTFIGELAATVELLARSAGDLSCQQRAARLCAQTVEQRCSTPRLGELTHSLRWQMDPVFDRIGDVRVEVACGADALERGLARLEQRQEVQLGDVLDKIRALEREQQHEKTMRATADRHFRDQLGQLERLAGQVEPLELRVDRQGVETLKLEEKTEHVAQERLNEQRRLEALLKVLQQEAKQLKDDLARCRVDAQQCQDLVTDGREQIERTHVDARHTTQQSLNSCKENLEQVVTDTTIKQEQNLRRLTTEIGERFAECEKQLTKYVQRGLVAVEQRITRKVDLELGAAERARSTELLGVQDALLGALNTSEQERDAQLAACDRRLLQSLADSHAELLAKVAQEAQDREQGDASAQQHAEQLLAQAQSEQEKRDLEQDKELEKKITEAVDTANAELSRVVAKLLADQTTRDEEQDIEVRQMVQDTVSSLTDKLQQTVAKLVADQDEKDQRQDAEVEERTQQIMATMSKQFEEVNAHLAADIKACNHGLEELDRKLTLTSEGVFHAASQFTLDTEQRLEETVRVKREEVDQEWRKVMQRRDMEADGKLQHVRRELLAQLEAMAANQVEFRAAVRRGDDQFTKFAEAQQLRDEGQDIEVRRKVDALIHTFRDQVEGSIAEVLSRQDACDVALDTRCREMVEEVVGAVAEELGDQVRQCRGATDAAASDVHAALGRLEERLNREVSDSQAELIDRLDDYVVRTEAMGEKLRRELHARVASIRGELLDDQATGGPPTREQASRAFAKRGSLPPLMGLGGP